MDQHAADGVHDHDVRHAYSISGDSAEKQAARQLLALSFRTLPVSLDHALSLVPVYVLVLTRLAGMMLFAPVFGSSRIPRRVKGMFIVVLAFGLTGGVPLPQTLPQTPWEVALGMGGELAFGLAIGMLLSMTFVAVQWAGEMVGQQMGLTLSEVLDPNFGSQGSPIGDMYFMLALIVFLSIGGHREMIHGAAESFRHLPLLAPTVTESMFDLLVGLIGAAAEMAFRLAAPALVTMLVLDLALGLIGKAMPQFNVMANGMSMRTIVGMVIVLIGIGTTSQVIRDSVMGSVNVMFDAWTNGS